MVSKKKKNRTKVCKHGWNIHKCNYFSDSVNMHRELSSINAPGYYYGYKCTIYTVYSIVVFTIAISIFSQYEYYKNNPSF